MVTDLDDALFKSKILNFDQGSEAKMLINKNTIIEFWVTWCGHCKAMRPIFESLSEKFPDIQFFRIEIEEHPNLAQFFGVEGFPTFLFLRPDGGITRHVGEMSSELFEKFIYEDFSLG